MKKVLKTIAAVTFAVLAAAVLPSCDKNSGDGPAEKPGTPGGEEEKPSEQVCTFEITLENLEPTGVDMSVRPSIQGTTYYFDILGKEAYSHLTESGLQTYFDGEVKRRMEAYDISKEEVLKRLISTTPENIRFSKLSPATDYYAIAFGVKEDGAVSTELTLKEFSTPAVNPSGNVLDITIGTIANNGADYKVVPSVMEDPYLVDAWPKSLVDELGDGETMRYFIEYNAFLIPTMTARGIFEYENEAVLQPGRDYYVIAFGYSDGEPTTKLYKKEFRTIGGDPEKCSFQYSYVSKAPTRVKIRVTPSDKQVVYMWDVIDMKTFNEFKQTHKTDEATLEYILNGVIEQSMVANGYKRQQAIEDLGRWSGFTTSDPEGYDEENITGLTAGAEYIVWSVAVDAWGKPQGKFYTDTFTTPTE